MRPSTRLRPSIALLSFLLSIALVAGNPISASADGMDGTPEEASDHMAALLKAENFTGFASTMHPESLKQLKSLFRDLVAVPEMGSSLAQVFFQVQDLEGYDALDEAEVMARTLRMMTQQPGTEGVFSNLEAESLSHVVEGDKVHVVNRVRTETGGITLTEMSVTTLRRDDDRWYGELTGEIRGLAAAIASGLGLDPAEVFSEGEDPAVPGEAADPASDDETMDDDSSRESDEP